MKNLKKQISVILAAAAVTVSAAGVFADAYKLPENYDKIYLGWELGQQGWSYTFFSEYDDDYCGPYDEIDGVVYDFDPLNNYICTGKHNGWVNYQNVENYRFYRDGLPYTGWLKNKSGAKKYCLDGFLVRGDFQIGDKIYSFDKNGIYLNKSRKPALTAECDKMIPQDTEKIIVTVRYNGKDSNKEYIVGEPEKMERWLDGEWKECIGSAGYTVSDIGSVISGQGGCSPNYSAAAFYPQVYMGIGDLPEGYYRIAVPCGETGDYLNTKKEVYTVFEAVPIAEVKMSEEIYTANDKSEDAPDIEFQAYVKINSEKLSGGKISIKISKRVVGGWETAVKPYDKSISCDDESADGTITVYGSMPPETGYYMTSISIDGSQCCETYSYFRVE